MTGDGSRGSRAARQRDRSGAERKSLSAAFLTGTVDGERVALAAIGAWTAERAAELEKIIEETAHRYKDARSVDIDLAKLERLDTFGAWLIERLKRALYGARLDRAHRRPLRRRSRPHG